MEMKFTTANFEEEVLKSEIPVLVDFYADWCGPCQMMAPVIGQLAGEYEGRVKIGKLNVDENPDIAVQYKLRLWSPAWGSLKKVASLESGVRQLEKAGAFPRCRAFAL